MQAAVSRRVSRRVARRRLGAVLSMELILVLPIVLGLIFASIEIGMIWAAGQRVHEAASAGCRVACFRGADETAVRRAVEQNLNRKSLISTYALAISQPDPVANEVCVSVAVPMKSAAPDLLRFLGFSLDGRKLVAQTVMRRE